MNPDWWYLEILKGKGFLWTDVLEHGDEMAEAVMMEAKNKT